MPMQRYKPEQIVTMLRQIEVGIANGKTTPQACKEAAITVQTFYRWRKYQCHVAFFRVFRRVVARCFAGRYSSIWMLTPKPSSSSPPATFMIHAIKTNPS